jgi:hypothetical protein
LLDELDGFCGEGEGSAADGGAGFRAENVFQNVRGIALVVWRVFGADIDAPDAVI